MHWCYRIASSDIDKYVSAKMPSETNETLFSLVNKHMVHYHKWSDKANKFCGEEESFRKHGKCAKKFPYKINAMTFVTPLLGAASLSVLYKL